LLRLFLRLSAFQTFATSDNDTINDTWSIFLF
jgi:hypothetical protein